MAWYHNVLPSIWSRIEWIVRIIRAPREIDNLKSRMQQSETNAPPKPVDIRLVHGIYWGRSGADPQVHPFCAGCAAQASWVPLTRDDRYANGRRRTDDRVFFRCPKCRWCDCRTLQQEREALEGKAIS